MLQGAAGDPERGVFGVLAVQRGAASLSCEARRERSFGVGARHVASLSQPPNCKAFWPVMRDCVFTKACCSRIIEIRQRCHIRRAAPRFVSVED